MLGRTAIRSSESTSDGIRTRLLAPKLEQLATQVTSHSLARLSLPCLRKIPAQLASSLVSTTIGLLKFLPNWPTYSIKVCDSCSSSSLF
jgi:hypothetical protein